MLSSYDIEILIGGLANLAAYGYAAFWASNIRRGLTVKLYRNQALGIGLVSIGLAFFTIAFAAKGQFLLRFIGTKFILADDISFGILFFATLPLFYWTDQSLQAARQSDPLERDQFHWSIVRRILWIVISICLIGLVISVTAAGVQNCDCMVGPQNLIIPATLANWGIPLASSAILLPFVWRRSNDITFRRHLKWFALSAILLGLSFVWLGTFGLIIPLNAYLASGGQYILVLLSAYFLYRSARAIVPLYSFKEKIAGKE